MPVSAYDWEFKTSLRSLDDCRRETLRLLRQIDLQVTEAPGASITEFTTRGATEGRPPTGAHGGGMHAEWSVRFILAWDDPVRLRTACISCSASIAKEVGQLRAWAREHLDRFTHLTLDPDREERIRKEGAVLDGRHAASIERICTLYQGWSPQDAAAVEEVIGSACTDEAIEKVRRANSLDRRNGEPVPVGRALEEAVLASYAVVQAAGGMGGMRKVAEEFDVGKSTVERIIKKARLTGDSVPGTTSAAGRAAP